MEIKAWNYAEELGAEIPLHLFGQKQVFEANSEVHCKKNQAFHYSIFYGDKSKLTNDDG